MQGRLVVLSAVRPNGELRKPDATRSWSLRREREDTFDLADECVAQAGLCSQRGAPAELVTAGGAAPGSGWSLRVDRLEVKS